MKLTSKLSEIKYEIRGRVMVEAEKYAAAGADILPLHIGNPGRFGFEPEPEVLEATRNLVTSSVSYSSSRGIPELIERIQARLNRFGVNGVSHEHIFVGNGVSELIMLACQSTFDVGDEVLVPAPDYPLWTAAIKLAGAKPVYYVCDEQEDWQPSMSDLKSKVNSKTKAIVIINPNNPTGAVYPRTHLDELAKFISEHDLVAMTDEIYNQLLFDDAEFTPFAKVLNEVDPNGVCISFDGISKNGFAAGFRCGWMSLSGDLSNSQEYLRGLNMLAALRLCPNVMAMHSACAFLDSDCSTKLPPAIFDRLLQQRDQLCAGLEAVEHLTFVKPKGAFYVFPRLDLKKMNVEADEDFAMALVREKGILTVPGTAFNCVDREHLRLVFLPEVKVLSQVAEKTSALIQSLLVSDT